MRTLALAALTGALAAHSPAEQQGSAKSRADQTAKTGQEVVQGGWLIVGLEAGGKAEPEKKYRGNTFRFTKDKETLREGQYPPVELNFTLGPARTPRTIGLTTKKGGG